MVRLTSQAARPSARGCDTDQHDRGVWWNRHSQGLSSSGFPAGIVGVNGVMRFLVLEEPMSTDGRPQFIPPLTPITTMRHSGANIRMKESGDSCWKSRMTAERPTRRSWLESDRRLAHPAQA